MTLPLITGALLRLRRGRARHRPGLCGQHAGRHRGGADRRAPRAAAARSEGHADRSARSSTRVLGLALLYRHAPRRPFLAALAGCLLARSCRLALLFELDANKMTAGVFRHGDLASSRDARDPVREGRQDGDRAPGGATATPAASAPTASPTGRSTWTATGAARLATKSPWCSPARCRSPSSRTRRRAAVIGIGTGLTMHTLLQSLTHRARGDRRDRGRDGRGLARLRAAQRRGVRRSARPRSSSTTPRPTSPRTTGATTSSSRSPPIPG